MGGAIHLDEAGAGDEGIPGIRSQITTVMKLLMVSRWLAEEYRRNQGAPGFFGELAEAIAGQGIDLTVLSQSDEAGLEPEPAPIRGLKMHVFEREKRQGSLWLFDKS